MPSIAKQLAYMPKARNRVRVDHTPPAEDNENFVHYTLDEERALAATDAANGVVIATAPSSPSSAISKSASALWLQSRMNPGNSGFNSRKQGPGGGGKGGNALGKMVAMGKADTRYLTNTSLPYQLPPPVAEEKGFKDKKIAGGGVDEDDKGARSNTLLQARVQSNRARDDFNSFMRSTRFAEKPNRLVRQCAHCQMLYSSGHSCSGFASAIGSDAK